MQMWYNFEPLIDRDGTEKVSFIFEKNICKPSSVEDFFRGRRTDSNFSSESNKQVHFLCDNLWSPFLKK